MAHLVHYTILPRYTYLISDLYAVNILTLVYHEKYFDTRQIRGSEAHSKGNNLVRQLVAYIANMVNVEICFAQLSAVIKTQSDRLYLLMNSIISYSLFSIYGTS